MTSPRLARPYEQNVFAVFNAFRAPPAEVVTVASIQKSAGSVYLLGDSEELRRTDDLLNVSIGQTIATGSEAGMALADEYRGGNVPAARRRWRGGAVVR